MREEGEEVGSGRRRISGALYKAYACGLYAGLFVWNSIREGVPNVSRCGNAPLCVSSI